MNDLTRRTRLALAALAALALTSCSPQPASPPEDRLCKVEPGSAEERLLRTVIRTKNFRTDWYQPSDRRWAERMEETLRDIADPAATYTVSGCAYVPNGQPGVGRATVNFAWVPSPVPARRPDDKESREYRVNGATGRSDDISTHLYVSCVLPGSLQESSRKVLLHADAAFTMNLGPVRDHGTQDQQLEFVYRMTHRATEVLGCENKPLAKEPVVKAVDAPVKEPGTPTPSRTP
ncbi:hypothetical protein [Streptomyces sp. NPDC090025]|uniref:hypothetical protein n=1 Tax=Streptomyces sp. NPDC090025 TaxID=3365922 RepID=UPI0038390002